jgi:hypothetical protein
VQVLVLGFDEPEFSGEVLSELTRLREAGIVRLLDLLLVMRSEDGSIHTIEGFEGMDSDLGMLAAAILGNGNGNGDSVGSADEASSDGGYDHEGAATWSLADVVPPGSTAAVALIEHMWARDLKAAIGRAGGVALDEAWLAPDELEALEVLMANRPR